MRASLSSARALVRARSAARLRGEGARAFVTSGMGDDDYLRVLSERTMIRGFEGPVERLMERVQERVRRQPGLLSFQTIVNAEEPTKVSVWGVTFSSRRVGSWVGVSRFQRGVPSAFC